MIESNEEFFQSILSDEKERETWMNVITGKANHISLKALAMAAKYKRPAKVETSNHGELYDFYGLLLEQAEKHRAYLVKSGAKKTDLAWADTVIKQLRRLAPQHPTVPRKR